MPMQISPHESKLTILILGGGVDPRGEDASIWIAGTGERLLVEHFVSKCAAIDSELIFAVRRQEIRRFHIDDVVRLAAPGARIVAIEGETAGAPCTALLCSHMVAPDEGLLILNSNEILEIDYSQVLSDFAARDLDAGVVVFPSIHPRYSYVQVDVNGLVVEASERRPISRKAIAGFFWYRKASDFFEAARQSIQKDAQVDGRFFMSLTFNELILMQKRIGIFEVTSKQYTPLKSRNQIATFEAGLQEQIDAL